MSVSVYLFNSKTTQLNFSNFYCMFLDFQALAALQYVTFFQFVDDIMTSCVFLSGDGIWEAQWPRLWRILFNDKDQLLLIVSCTLGAKSAIYASLICRRRLIRSNSSNTLCQYCYTFYAELLIFMYIYGLYYNCFYSFLYGYIILCCCYPRLTFSIQVAARAVW